MNSDLSAELRLASGQMMADDLSLVSSGGMGGMSSSDPSLSSLSPPISDPSLRLYQCAVCNCYSTDSLEALSAHVNAERSLPEEEWRCVVGDVYQCKLCTYNTQLKANFQLHCKTDKHMQKHQLVAHIKEGGKANQWRLKCVAIGNPVHLKCNACDYYSNSVDKLRLHATNHRHEAAIRLYKVNHLPMLWHKLRPSGLIPTPIFYPLAQLLNNKHNTHLEEILVPYFNNRMRKEHIYDREKKAAPSSSMQ